MIAHLSPGSEFAGDFRILRPLGSGGMGAVYEVEQLSTRKHRALKILSTRIGDDARAHQRFVREATVASQIRSEHVVDVIAAGIEPRSGLPWLAMELLDGLDLRRVVRGHGRLSPSHALTVFVQVGHGLAAAHRAGVIHRDLKPENVFVARSHRAGTDFVIKLLDFGIAKLASESVASTDTAAVGSPMWMSPEQINAETLSARTDVWSLGLLAFWALTGRIYWRAAHADRVTVQALFAEQLFAPLQEASARASQYGAQSFIPPDFDAWFAGCVARDPARRFADASAAIFALTSILEPLARRDDVTGPLLPATGEPLDSGAGLTPVYLGKVEPAGLLEGTTGAAASDGELGTIAATDVSISARAIPAHVATAPSARVHAERTRHPSPPDPPARDRGRLRWALAAAIPAAAVAAAITGLVLTWPWASSEPTEPTAPTVVEDASATAAATGEEPSREPTPTPTTPTPVRVWGADELGPVDWEFLGWTVDGDEFVLRRMYRGDAAQAEPVLELLEVHDAYTATATEHYRIVPEDPETQQWPQELDEVVRNAGDEASWLLRRTELLLRQPHARRRTATGEILLGVDDVPLGSKTRLVPKTTGYEIQWYGVSALGSGLQPSLPGPRIEIGFAGDSGRFTIGRLRVGPDYDEVASLAEADHDPPAVHTLVSPYWSPRGDRSLILVETSASGAKGILRAESWMLRAHGPVSSAAQ